MDSYENMEDLCICFKKVSASHFTHHDLNASVVWQALTADEDGLSLHEEFVSHYGENLLDILQKVAPENYSASEQTHHKATEEQKRQQAERRFIRYSALCFLERITRAYEERAWKEREATLLEEICDTCGKNNPSHPSGTPISNATTAPRACSSKSTKRNVHPSVNYVKSANASAARKPTQRAPVTRIQLPAFLDCSKSKNINEPT